METITFNHFFLWERAEMVAPIMSSSKEICSTTKGDTSGNFAFFGVLSSSPPPSSESIKRVSWCFDPMEGQTIYSEGNEDLWTILPEGSRLGERTTGSAVNNQGKISHCGYCKTIHRDLPLKLFPTSHGEPRVSSSPLGCT